MRISVLFFFRRFIILGVLIILPRWMNCQIFSQIISSLAIAVFTIHYFAYESKKQNMLEALNECAVLVGSYHLFMFTKMVFKEELRLEIGWSLIYFIAFNTIFNISLVCFNGVKQFCLKLKLKYT